MLMVVLLTQIGLLKYLTSLVLLVVLVLVLATHQALHLEAEVVLDLHLEAEVVLVVVLVVLQAVKALTLGT